jgi:predicted outer membrane protein
MLEKHWNRMSMALAAAVFAAVACSKGDNAGGDTATDSGSVSAGNTAPGANAVDPSMVMSFLRTVDSHEIEAGKVAQTKGTNAQVKEFARMMVTDHCRSLTTAASATAGPADTAKRSTGSASASTAECDRLVVRSDSGTNAATSGPAAQGGAEMQQMQQKHQQEMQTLNSTAKGAKFDSTYMAAMVNGHQEVLSRLESMRGTGGSASGSASAATAGGTSAPAGATANPGTGSPGAAGSPNTTQPASTANQTDATQTQLQNAINMVRTHLERAQEVQRALQGSGK